MKRDILESNKFTNELKSSVSYRNNYLQWSAKNSPE